MLRTLAELETTTKAAIIREAIKLKYSGVIKNDAETESA